MGREELRQNPRAFIALGASFIGAGVALSVALMKSGAAGAGIGLLGMGVVFLVLGLRRKREA